MADGPEPKPSDDLIKRQAEEIARLRAEVERLERDRQRLRRDNERLRKDLEAARRAGYRQAAPFSKGVRTAHPRRPGRKAGPIYRRQGSCRAALVRALHRATAKALPTYGTLERTVRSSPMVVLDETGWRVHTELQWLWKAVTRTTTVYAILSGLGFEEAACLLGPAFAGVLVRDGWAPYAQVTEAAHQTCLTHLDRRARELRTEYPCALLPGQVQEVLHDALDVRDRYTAGTISEQGPAIARGRVINRLLTLASVLRTARPRGLDRHAIVVAMLRAPTPIVSPAFQ